MMRPSPLVFAISIGLMVSAVFAAESKNEAYRVVQTARVGGAGGFDYVFADDAGRKLYIPRGNRVTVFDLDSLKPAGEIPDAKSVHGAMVDPKSHHGFSSSNPVLMWDTNTLAVLKSIPVEGNPDGIHFDAGTQRVWVLSHRAPNATVIDARDGSIVGTVDLGGAPEQAVSDGKGRIYIDIEDKDNVAVVDATTMKVLAHFDLGGKGGTPAGLAMDVKNRLLFACCRNPATAVVLNADDGKILAALPIGAGTDGAVFNAATGEAFSSNRDGTLSVIKVGGPTNFAVTQTVATMAGAKTCTLDAKTGRVLLIAAETAPAPAAAPSDGGQKKKGGGRGQMVPDSFTILAVGR
jgi:DNA-binding beta-propeller fold protein YncE